MEKPGWTSPAVAEAYRKKLEDAWSHNAANKHHYHDPYLRVLIGSIEALDVLDVGAGTLELASMLPQARSFTALDFPGVMPLDFFAGIQKKEGSAEEMPFPDNSFDLVYSALMMQWVQDYERVIQQKYRVLRSGGRCVFTIVNPLVFRRGEYGEDARGFPIFVEDPAQKADFSEEEVMLSTDIGPVDHYRRPPTEYLESLMRAGFTNVNFYFPFPFVSKGELGCHIHITDGTHKVDRFCLTEKPDKWEQVRHMQQYQAMPLFVGYEGWKK